MAFLAVKWTIHSAVLTEYTSFDVACQFKEQAFRLWPPQRKRNRRWCEYSQVKRASAACGERRFENILDSRSSIGYILIERR